MLIGYLIKITVVKLFKKNLIICEGDKFVFTDLGCQTVNGFIIIDVILFRSRHYC